MVVTVLETSGVRGREDAAVRDSKPAGNTASIFAGRELGVASYSTRSPAP
ncbi:hypothetical protein B0G83_102631 [Paraburkholderia sp. BL21I4N1]|nr:hypothetical protein B0G83_102631 [Paraburkholderia sp. BL21I4N1]